MAQGFVVRPAREDDLDFVRRDREIPEATVRHKISAQDFFVAERNGGRAGFVCLEYLWSKFPFISLIWVAPEYRRQGIGRALLDHAEGFLRARGHNALYSSSVATEPEPQEWHRHMGFRECGIITGINPGGIGEVFFVRNLNSKQRSNPT